LRGQRLIRVTGESQVRLIVVVDRDREVHLTTSVWVACAQSIQRRPRGARGVVEGPHPFRASPDAGAVVPGASPSAEEGKSGAGALPRRAVLLLLQQCQ
jgi:hypothetical protein